MFYFAKMLAQGDDYTYEHKMAYLYGLKGNKLDLIHKFLLDNEELKNTEKGKEALKVVETMLY